MAERVRELTRGHGADVVFELVATQDTMAASTAALAKRGRLVFIGYSEDSYTVHPIQLVITEASVTGSVGNTPGELMRAADLVARGKVATVVDHLPLERFQDGLDALARASSSGARCCGPERLQPGGEVTMMKQVLHDTQDYLAQRLDGARDLYLLALALGERGDPSGLFGRMIREARIHFAAVIEECRIAGLDTSDIAALLGQATDVLADSIRPELRERLEQLVARPVGRGRRG